MDVFDTSWRRRSIVEWKVAHNQIMPLVE